MHKGAILDVHIVRSLRIAFHAGLKGDSRCRSARRSSAGNDKRSDPAVTLRSVGLLGTLRTIWSSAFLRRPMVSAGYSGLKVSPSSGLFVCCMEPKTHEYSRSLGRLLGRTAAVSALIGRIERIGSSTKNACLFHELKAKSRPSKRGSVLIFIEKIERDVATFDQHYVYAIAL